MVGKTANNSYGSSPHMPEELSLLHHKTRGSQLLESGGWCQRWKDRLLGSLAPRCVVCLQVQHVTGMPPAAEGRGVVVGWRSKGSGGEHTAPARVSQGGTAAFDEVFLRYLGAGRASLRGFAVWASLVVDSATSGLGGGGGGGDVGVFPIDVLAFTGKNHGGNALSFPLRAAAAGAVLTVSVDCRLMGQGEMHGANVNGHARETKNKGKRSSYASCLPDLRCLRNQPAPPLASSGSAHPATSLRFERIGFITIENTVAEMKSGGCEEHDDEDVGFITMENGTISSGSRSALHAEALMTGDDTKDDGTGMPEDDEKPCLFIELSGDDAVEDEFLAMLEDNCWTNDDNTYMANGKEIDQSLSLDIGLDLDSLVKDAEMELTRAEQAWKSKVSATIVEEMEYKELVNRWSTRTSGALASADPPSN